jgi:hypothetical protein
MSNKSEFAVFEALDLAPIKMKLMHVESGEGWSERRATAVEAEYRRFLFLTKTYPDEMVSPTMDVDMFWHYHILDTMKYARDCDALFGTFLHHYPYVGMGAGSDDSERVQAGDRMREMYEAQFGAVVRGDAAWCGAPGKEEVLDAAWCGAPGKQASEAAWCGAPGKQATDAAWCGAPGKAAAKSTDAAWCGAPGKKLAKGNVSAWCGAPGKKLADNVKTAWCGAPGKALNAGNDVAWCGAPGAAIAGSAVAWCGAPGKALQAA